MKKSKLNYFLIIVSLFSCLSKKDKCTISFNEFYEKFHIDSLYQLNHIKFPIDDKKNYTDFPNFNDNSDTDIVLKSEKWTKKN